LFYVSAQLAVMVLCMYLFKVMLESVKQHHRDMEKGHREEIKRTKDELTQQLEEKWKDRLKYVHLTVATCTWP
jgi:Ca2+/H+ antiporter